MEVSQTASFFRFLLLSIIQAHPFLARPTTLSLRRQTRMATHVADDVEKLRNVCKHTARASSRPAGRAYTGR
jgi:hypothetical protein